MKDPQDIPRFSGIATFMRTAYEPNPKDLDADIAYVGAPWDCDSGLRVGQRWAPRAIRNASCWLRPYSPYLDIDLRDYDIVDNGDIKITPGDATKSFESIQERIEKILNNGVIPAVAGGNHGISLFVLRAVAEIHGPISLIQFDAHSDLRPETSYYGVPHPVGTFVHTAIEEGLIDPETSVRIGDRGSLYDEEYKTMKDESKMEYIMADEFERSDTSEIIDRISDIVGDDLYLTIDIDSIDPSFAPGMSVPQPGGLTPRELFAIIRSTKNKNIVGFDHVEVCPPYDSENLTSYLAATIMQEAVMATLHPTE